MQIIDYLMQQSLSSTLKIHSEGYHPVTPSMQKSRHAYTACLLDKWQHEHYVNAIRNDGELVEATTTHTAYYKCHRMMKGDHTKWVSHYLIGKAILILVRPVEDTKIILERVCILSRNK